jgi:hypothetical protein
METFHICGLRCGFRLHRSCKSETEIFFSYAKKNICNVRLTVGFILSAVHYSKHHGHAVLVQDI